MKILKKALKVLGVLVLLLLVLAGYLFITYKYQFNSVPEKELKAYNGQSVEYPFVDGRFELKTEKVSVTTVLDSLSVPNPESQFKGRRTISLNGVWDIAEGDLDELPSAYNNTVQVPGYADMAEPGFAKVGEVSPLISLSVIKPSNFLGLPRVEDNLREAFWYRRYFTIDQGAPQTATLKVKRAKFGSTVWINGNKAGSNGKNFSNGIYDITKYIKPNGERNEIVISVGTSTGYDEMKNVVGDVLELNKKLPGIYDDVELQLSGSLKIEKVQVVPQVGKPFVKVVSWIQNTTEEELHSELNFTIKTYQQDSILSKVKTKSISVKPGAKRIIEVDVPLTDQKLWYPESPNLYTLTTATTYDALQTRFGIREFIFDAKTKVPMLNGSPYYLRGTSVPFYRFSSDPERGDKPWNEKWVRKLFKKFKSLHWNSLRFHIGPAPEMWYRIADEEGMLIQDEYAVWSMNLFRLGVSLETLIPEYIAWMEERWNYPSIVIWDAQNETDQKNEPRTGWAINMLRPLDLSNRPWDNGWGDPQAETDLEEQHPYKFFDAMSDVYRTTEIGPLYDMAELNKFPADTTNIGEKGNPVIVNEYAWLWVRRDGEPTALTKAGYEKYFPDFTAEQRFEYYARNTAAFTELYRSQRPAGVMQFAGLNNNYPGSKTSDIFLDLKELTIEPHIQEYFTNAFNPLGICIYNWSVTIAPKTKLNLPVTLINDKKMDWEGSISIEIMNDGTVVWEKSKDAKVKAFGKSIADFSVEYPEKSGNYQMIAEITDWDGNPVKSIRKFKIE